MKCLACMACVSSIFNSEEKNEEALLVKSTTASTHYTQIGYPHTHVVFLQHWLDNVSITTLASSTLKGTA